MEPNIILLTPYAGTAETNHLQEHIAAAGFTCTQFLETSPALKFLTSNSICAIVAKLGQSEKDYPMPLIQAAQLKNPQIFNCIFSSTAVRNAVLRTNCCENGANMVTNNFDTLDEALKIVKEFITKSGTYACPMCGGGALDEDRLQRHTFLYHNQSRARKFTCPVCVKETSPYAVHLFNKHGPAGRHECLAENEMTVRNTYTFTLLVCQRKSDGKFLLVQEVASWGWWLPGGRINQNEDLIQSALRETKEEAGIDAKITGILRFEYNAREEDARMRVIFYGEPIDESQEPKTLPDFESMGAAWVDVSQLQKLPLRSHEPTDWFTYVQQGGTIYPISMLTHEGAPPPLTSAPPSSSKKKQKE